MSAGHGHSHGVAATGHRRPLAIVLGITGTILIAAVLVGRPATDARTWGHSTFQFEPASHAAHEHHAAHAGL